MAHMGGWAGLITFAVGPTTVAGAVQHWELRWGVNSHPTPYQGQQQIMRTLGQCDWQMRLDWLMQNVHVVGDLYIPQSIDFTLQSAAGETLRGLGVLTKNVHTSRVDAMVAMSSVVLPINTGQLDFKGSPLLPYGAVS